MKSLLALDLGTQTGYCWVANGVISWGTWRLKHHPKTLICCLDLWQKVNGLSLPRHVCWERTYAQGWALRLLSGMEAMVEVWCLGRNISYDVVTPTQWKKQLLGRAHATQQDYCNWVQQRYPVSNADEAAALCIAAYVCAKYGIEFDGQGN